MKSTSRLISTLSTVQAVHCALGYKRRSLEFERLPQLSGIARVDLKDAAEGVRMAAVGKFCRDEEAKLGLVSL